MARVVPSFDEAHLIVAGIRVQTHRDGRPPLLEDVATLLAMPADLLRVLVVELEERGILRQLTNAFEVRLDVLDHTRIEELPREGSGSRMNAEVDEFRKAFKEKQKNLKETFGSGALEKKAQDKMSRLEEELQKFKKKDHGPMFSSLGDPPPLDKD